jgi:hypothetical protein
MKQVMGLKPSTNHHVVPQAKYHCGCDGGGLCDNGAADSRWIDADIAEHTAISG